MKNIAIILKKELKRYFTDIRMLIGILLPGILIFVLYSVMGGFMNSMNDAPTEYNICIVNEPAEFSNFKDVDGWEIHLIASEDITKEDALKKIENKEFDLYIEFEEDFYQKIQAYDSSASASKAPEVKMYYNSTSDASLAFYQYYSSVLNTFESTLTNRFDINNSENEKYDFATAEDASIQIFTMMLPFLLIIFLFSGCMGVCSEAIAGEKERGTIATLLVTPVKRSQIAIGKLIALSLTSLASATASFIGLVASIPRLVGSSNISLNIYGFGSYALIFVVILCTVLLFSVILTMISTYAKSVKESTSLAIPVMMIVMLLGVTSFMGTSASTNLGLYFIPVYNSIQCLTAIFSMEIQPAYFAVTIISNVVFIAAGVYALTKMFNSEKIMFNK